MITFSSHVQGASHLKYDPPVPCQDYSGAFASKDPPYGVAAIADGHGSAKYIRCATGSLLAVEVALAAAKEYMESPEIEGRTPIAKMILNLASVKEYMKSSDIEERIPMSQVKSNDVKAEKEIDGMLKHLKTYVVYKWRERVQQHFEENPLSENELEICSKEKLDMSNDEWYVTLYGSTLIFAVLFPFGAIAFQIGDGGCVLLEENEEPKLLEDIFDKVQEGGKTNSLCSSNAAENFKHVWLHSRNLKGITVASDGVTDSFDRSNDSYLKFTKTLFQNFETSPTATVKTKLDEYLPELSRQGSADDMSIAGVFILDERIEEAEK